MATLNAVVEGNGSDEIAIQRSIDFFSSPSGDAVPPVVVNASPAPGSRLARNGTVSFDVTDNDELRRVFVMAIFGNGDWEVVHDGSSFAPRYRTSQRTTITGGFSFVVRRSGGWVLAPTVRIVPIDRSGNEEA